MEDEKSASPEPLPCPICRRPLRRTPDRLLSALECEQCGPFSDFDNRSSRWTNGGSDQGPDGSGSPTN